MPTKRKATKPYWEMSADDLAEATREFDSPSPPPLWRPLSSEEQKRFERVRRAGGNDPRHILSVSLEPKLFSEALAYARKHGLTLPEVIARAVRGLLAFSQ